MASQAELWSVVKCSFRRLPGKSVDADHVGDEGHEAQDGHGHALHPEPAGLDLVVLVEAELPTAQVGLEHLRRDGHVRCKVSDAAAAVVVTI